MLTIRKAEGPDFGAAADCLNAVFEGSYLNPRVFEAGYLAARVAAGGYQLLVAAEPGGTVAATGALYQHEWFPGGAEVCLLATRPSHRGLGLGGRLMGRLTGMAVDSSAYAAFACCATHVPQSQHLLQRHGYVPTGFWFSEYDPAKQAASFNHASCKLTSEAYVRPGHRTQHRLYLPKSLKPLAARIYRPIGPACFPEETGAPAPETKLTLWPNDYHATDYLFVDACGPDLREKLAAIAPRTEGRTAVLFLDVAHASAAQGYAALLEAGFRFAGFIPAAEGREYLIMSRRGAEPFVPEELSLTGASQALLKDILSQQQAEEAEYGR